MLHHVQGMALISGYPCDLYANLYDDWKMVTTDSFTDNQKQATEALWLSPITWVAFQAEQTEQAEPDQIAVQPLLL